VRQRDRLIEAEIPRLRQYVRALIGQADQADDLVEACLEQAIAEAGDEWSRTALRLSLFRRQHEICLAWLAKRDRSNGNAVADAVLLREDGARDRHPGNVNLRSALECLPAEQRAVILLIALQGLSYEQAAEVLEVPVGTIRTQLAGIREGLRQQAGGDAAQLQGGGTFDQRESSRP
jgi:RNA polymerase sigma-70 factor (ECF subfamily)